MHVIAVCGLTRHRCCVPTIEVSREWWYRIVVADQNTSSVAAVVDISFIPTWGLHKMRITNYYYYYGNCDYHCACDAFYRSKIVWVCVT